MDVRRPQTVNRGRFFDAATRATMAADPGLRSHRSRRPPGLEPREQVIRPRPPGSRIAPTPLGLVEPSDLLVPGRQGVRVLEPRNHLDGLEEIARRSEEHTS